MKNKTLTFLLGMTSMAVLLSLASMTAANRQHQEMDLGTFSISLAVKDIAKSKTFYEKLGFEALKGAGSVEQKWIIMKSGTSKIGLFQGLFPTNTITFNPLDARPIHQSLVKDGIEMAYAVGLDKDAGPCTFSFMDPDGNPIMMDQH